MTSPSLPFPPEMVAASDAPLVRLVPANAHRPAGAHAAVLVSAPPERAWEVIGQIEELPSRVPMIHRVTLEGDRVAIRLRFKMSVISVGFGFAADVIRDEGRALELRWVSGEPHRLGLRFDLVRGADPGSTILYVAIGFDIESLGWLVKLFLKHHPEIRFGVYSGTALTMLDAIQAAAEGRS